MYFMEDYFKPIEGLKLENDKRPIPGGRYGCAQFLKLFGTK